jgi:hypothetical protein
MTSRLMRIADEVRFFPNYRHHVATSNYVGDVLRTICDVARVFRGPAWFSHCHVEMPSLDAGLLVLADVGTPYLWLPSVPGTWLLVFFLAMGRILIYCSI